MHFLCFQIFLSDEIVVWLPGQEAEQAEERELVPEQTDSYFARLTVTLEMQAYTSQPLTLEPAVYNYTIISFICVDWCWYVCCFHCFVCLVLMSFNLNLNKVLHVLRINEQTVHYRIKY